MALRLLAAEILQEIDRVDRTVDEAGLALARLEESSDRITLYAAAALMDTFYTGVEKTWRRILPVLNGELPQGPAWHRHLLESMATAIPEVRPAVIGLASAQALEPYLSFRHRFRNLYLFDLEPSRILALLSQLSPCWHRVRTDLTVFAGVVVELAAALEQKE